MATPESFEIIAAGRIIQKKVTEGLGTTRKEDRAVVEASKWEFYALYSGKGLAELEDIQITVPPMIKFRLHDLIQYGWTLKVRQKGYGAMYGSPNKHRFQSAAEVSFKSRPKVSLIATGLKNGQIKFKLPSRSLYQNMAEVIEDLKNHNFEISNVSTPVGLETHEVWRPTNAYQTVMMPEESVVDEKELRKKWLEELDTDYEVMERYYTKWFESLDEIMVTRMFNDRRYLQLMKLLKQQKLVTPDMPPDMDNIIDFVEALKQRNAAEMSDELEEKIKAIAG